MISWQLHTVLDTKGYCSKGILTALNELRPQVASSRDVTVHLRPLRRLVPDRIATWRLTRYRCGWRSGPRGSWRRWRACCQPP